MAQEYDIIIIGGGAAGLTAGLYAARARRKTILFEKAVPGGQIATTSLVENYPGFPEGIDGPDLAERMEEQAKKYGLEMVFAEAEGLTIQGARRVVHTSEGEFVGKAVIITSGAEHRKLGVPGEAELTGRGVSYCATCDAAFFKDQVVVVVGGGDAALDEGLFLTRYAAKVIVVHRRDQLRASRVLQERAFATPKMEFVWDTVVEEILGESKVGGVRVRNVKTGQGRTIAADGVFVYIGLVPQSDFLKGLLPIDGGGHLEANLWMETAIPGVFAAGDVRVNAARQLVSAAGDGCTAAIRADHYLNDLIAQEQATEPERARA
ncbi:MAG: thioredoxin-disulfide reductase [Chloroflexi bacterium]|nr:thioredoxin-disulfide reductase [Chloroflexota bacterium]